MNYEENNCSAGQNAEGNINSSGDRNITTNIEDDVMSCEESERVSIRHDVTARKSDAEAACRRVSFPKSDNELVTGYLEPANPWESVSIVKTVNELSELYLKSCKKHNTEPLKCVLDHLNSLELGKVKRQSCLSLKNNKLTPDSCEALEEILKRVQYELIDLSECELNDSAASALFDMIEYYEAATEVDISGNPDLSSRAIASCVSMIRRSRALQGVTIRGTALSEGISLNLGKSLNNSCLHTIKLEHCGLTGRPLAALCSALKKNHTLKELWLAHNNLAPVDAEKLAELIKSNGYLEFLDISNNSIEDQGVKYIVTALIEQSTYIEGYSSQANSDTSDVIDDKLLESTPAKAVNAGRSMLDTLLNMNTETPNVEIKQSVDDDAWDFGQNDDGKTKDEGLRISETAFSSLNEKEQMELNSCSSSTSSTNIVVEAGETVDGNKLQNDSIISTNNNEYSTCKVNETFDEQKQDSQTKALDFNKNSKMDEMETSSDSAFESASEGDLRFKEAPKINNYISSEFETNTYTKDPVIVGENLSDSGIAFSESRIRSLSSDSLSSENSLDTTDTNLLDKINEKITKNDTLTRQKHIEEPRECSKAPKGLQALILWNNIITRDCGEYISDLLATTNSLELLNIGKNILSNDFIIRIEGSLRTNTTLTNLGLQSAHLSCAGIKALSSVLQFGGNCTLERIDIRDNNLQVDGLTALAEALKSNKSVTRLDVDDVPKRISDGANDMQFHYSRVLHTLRSLCSRNGTCKESATLTNNVKKTGQYLTSRKISLTCPSIRTPLLEPPGRNDQHTADTKKKSNVRLRSPLPSPPTSSPSSSPVPSPSRNRFQVFRVAENKTPISKSLDSGTMQKNKPKHASPFKSRFQVTLVQSSESVTSIVKKLDVNSTKTNESTKAPIVTVSSLDNVDSKEQSTSKTDILVTSKNVENKIDSPLTMVHSENDRPPPDSCSQIKISPEMKNSTQESGSAIKPILLVESNADKVESTSISNVGTKRSNLSDKVQTGSLYSSKFTSSVVASIPEELEASPSGDPPQFPFIEATGKCLNENEPKCAEKAVTCSNEDSSSSNETIISDPTSASEKITPEETSIDEDINIEEDGSAITITSENKHDTLMIIEDNLEATTTEVSSIIDDNINKKEQLDLNVPQNESDKCAELNIKEDNEVDLRTCETAQNIKLNDEMKTETETNRVRKTSWISAGGCPSTVDKLLSLFHHPGNLFTRTSSPELEKKSDDCEATSQSLVSLRKQSPPGLFSWNKNVPDTKLGEVKRLSSENLINSTFQTSFLDVASKQIRGIADFGKQVFRQNISFGDAINTEPPHTYESIPSEDNYEIKENISPQQTITPNTGRMYLQNVQEGCKTISAQASNKDEAQESVHNNPGQGGKLAYDPDLSDPISSDFTGNNL